MILVIYLEIWAQTELSCREYKFSKKNGPPAQKTQWHVVDEFVSQQSLVDFLNRKCDNFDD